MTRSSRKKKTESNKPEQPGIQTFQRELIVVASAEIGLRASPGALRSMAGGDIDTLADILTSEGAVIRPLFGVGEDQMQAEASALVAETGAEVPDLSVYYRVEAPEEKLDQLAERLGQVEGVEGAYVKPPAEPAEMRFVEVPVPAESAPPQEAEQLPPPRLNEMQPALEEAPAFTPDFSPRQQYLDAAPAGVDARYAWTVPGGTGWNVRIIDIEWGWNFSQEDLVSNQGGMVSGENATDTNHGTAVLGEFSGDRNAFGIAGISPDAHVRTVSLVSHGTSEAIRIAADNLRPGDIILLEVHRAGPSSAAGNGQFGYIAIEWWPDDFAAIRYAVSKGIIVVEAAGNGGQNLDDPIYNTPAPGFPASWKNPFNMANPLSGAVVVGAGCPPSPTHGRSFQPIWGDIYADRGRCFFSNYGSRVDCQGWGWEVTTTGYGDLQGGPDPNFWYTDQFSGTSSASPIVVGVLASLQGVLRAHDRIPLSPGRARDFLRNTGSPQQDAPAFTFFPNMAGTGYPQNHPPRPGSQRIGNLPNLRQLIALVLENRNWIGVQFTGSVAPRTTQGWFTSNWPAHWHVLWTVVPNTSQPGVIPIEWNVKIERASDLYITYWISVTNLTDTPVQIEARYAVLGW